MKITQQTIVCIVHLVALIIIPACAHKHTRNVEAYYEKAAQCSEMRNFKQALIYAEKAVILQPSPRALALKATLLYQNGKLQESKKTFELALKEKTISPLIKTTILNNYAAVLVQLGHRKQAHHVWQQLTKNKFYTTPEVAWLNLGIMHWEDSKCYKKRTHQEELNALHCFSQALALEPSYVDAYFFKAHVLVTQKRKSEARKALKKVIAFEPRHTQAQMMLRSLTQSYVA